MSDPAIPGSPPGGGYVALALRWLRSIAGEHPWMRIEPHQWQRGDLLVTVIPQYDPANGPLYPLSGWTSVPGAEATLAYRIATGDETQRVLCAVRFAPTKDNEVTTDPDVDPDPEP